MRRIPSVVGGVTLLLGTLAGAAPASAATCSIPILCGRTSVSAPTIPPPTIPPPTIPAPTIPAPVPAPRPTPPPAPAVGADERALAGRLADHVNRERTARGLHALRARSEIVDIARQHASTMAARAAISHNDGYFTAAVRRRLGATALGENVAMNPSVDDAHERLMRSDGHRANILDPRFTQIGVAIVATPSGQLFIVENFAAVAGGSVAPAPVAATPAPRTVSAPQRAAAPARRTRRAAEPGTAPAPIASTAAAPPPSIEVAAPLSGNADVTATFRRVESLRLQTHGPAPRPLVASTLGAGAALLGLLAVIRARGVLRRARAA